jgi:hypothetical protein
LLPTHGKQQSIATFAIGLRSESRRAGALACGIRWPDRHPESPYYYGEAALFDRQQPISAFGINGSLLRIRNL